MKAYSQATRNTTLGEIARDLRDFHSTLSLKLNLLEQARRSLNVYLSQDFNVFDYIEPDENAISQVLADLLNPHGPHGQGKVFLDAFLRAVGHSERTNGSSQARVGCQTHAFASTGGFIDITIDLPDKFGIAIENKPWAIEQPNQLARYAQHLERVQTGGFCLVFLEARGIGFTSIAPGIAVDLEKAGKLRTLKYVPELKAWIELCAKESQSDKLRWFLRDFAGYLDRTFSAEEGPACHDQ